MEGCSSTQMRNSRRGWLTPWEAGGYPRALSEQPDSSQDWGPGFAGLYRATLWDRALTLNVRSQDAELFIFSK